MSNHAHRQCSTTLAGATSDVKDGVLKVNIPRNDLKGTGAYTFGTEQINNAGVETKNVGGLFEADYVVTEKVAVFGRYDYFDPNDAVAKDDLSGPVAGVTYRFIELGRAVFEYHKQGKQPASAGHPASSHRERSRGFAAALPRFGEFHTN